MQKKTLIVLLLFTMLAALLAGCGHEHTWAAATCMEPKRCLDCDETEGEPLGHNFAEATCETPSTCSRCGETTGEALGHDFAEATCTEPATCVRCGSQQGEALGHKFSEATCTQLATCSRCQETTGELLPHTIADAEVITEPTCTKSGEAQGVCTSCGKTVTTTIDATGHTEGKFAVETKATYWSAGKKVKRCTVCDEILETKEYELSDEEKEEDFKADCTSCSYEDLARDPDAFMGENVKVTGEVIQVLEDGNICELRINITKKRWGYTDTIYVSYVRKDGESRILEDDVVTVWGWGEGNISYTSILGQTITLPYVDAEYLSIN
jgi:hypothetical protein